MTTIADHCGHLPVATFAPGEILLAEGEKSGRLYVLEDGVVEILKGDFQINEVADRGAVLGEMSVLLDMPHMATVRAVTPVTVRLSEAGDALLRSESEITYLVARMLATRLNGVTAYLMDLKRQFEHERGHLGMVDEILESLVHDQASGFEAGSDRDQGYLG